MQYLKADTNTEVLIGPVVAVGDGFTPVTTLSPSTADEAELIKYGGATPLTVTAINASTMTAITGADGYYTLDLSTGNTDTEGFLTVLFNDDSLCLPVRHDFMVVNANVYDSLFAASGTDTLDVQVAGMDAGTVTAAAVASGAIDADALAADCITAAKIAANSIGSSELATDCLGSDQLSAAAVTKIMASVVETQGSYTLQQAISIILSAVAGVSSSGGAVLESPDGVATRISATIDGSNNRTAMSLTPSS
jgi:hypothetical protein